MRKTSNIRTRTKPRLKRDVGIPNKATKRALRDVRARKNLETFENVGEWAKSVRGL